MIPKLCKGCKGIYSVEEALDPLANCFICVSPLCPDCFPLQRNPHKGYVPICLECYDKHKSKEFNEVSYRSETPLNSTLQEMMWTYQIQLLENR